MSGSFVSVLDSITCCNGICTIFGSSSNCWVACCSMASGVCASFGTLLVISVVTCFSAVCFLVMHVSLVWFLVFAIVIFNRSVNCARRGLVSVGIGFLRFQPVAITFYRCLLMVIGVLIVERMLVLVVGVLIFLDVLA